ncbi:MAG: DUF805 domain-containing protein [Victivallaceae bacterium]|nr:DUF805 domain-containing protein [Victivallaceae bacterium]
MPCQKCGAALPENAVFCPICGTRIVENPAVPAPPDLFTALKKYADFQGRASRQEYWLFVLLRCIAEVLLAGFPFLLGAWEIAMIVPGLAVTARRLHDVGSNGWRMLCSLIPVVGPVAMFCWMLHDSQPGINAYGENPKGVAAGDPEWRFKSWIGWTVGIAVLVLMIAAAAVAVATDAVAECSNCIQ